jgi:flagellar hook assembly protein FlgD
MLSAMLLALGGIAAFAQIAPLTISASPTSFNPSTGQTTTITYTNTVAVYSASVTVRNSSSVTVSSLASHNMIGTNTRTTAWDGKNGSGQIVPAGQYTVVFAGNSKDGTAIPPATTIVTVMTTTTTAPPPSGGTSPLSVSVSPSTINATQGQTTTVTYTNTERIYSPRVTVRNSSSVTVKSLASYNLIGERTRTATWDGKDTMEQIVPSGQYTVVFEGKTSTGVAIPPATANISVLTTAPPPPTIYTFTINSITPTTIDATLGQTTTIKYTVPVTNDLRVYVKNSAGTEVRTLEQVTGAAAGSRTVIWNGKNSAGSVVPDGAYTVTVETRSTTPTIQPASGTVTVKTATVTPPPSPPTGGEKGQLIEGGGSANFAWLKYAGYKAGIAFQSPKSGSITQITLQWKKSGGYGAGNYGTYTFELQTNGAGNFPSGTVIGKATNINPITAMDGYADGAFHFPISASLTAGQIYHLVITNTDSSPGTNWSSPNGLMTRVQTWDGTGNRTAYYSSGSWKPWSSQDNPWNTSGGNNVNGHHTPTMLTWSDGTTTGDPYYSAAISSGARFYGTSRAGQYIVWNGPTTTVSRIGVSVKRIGSPSGALIYHLERVGSGDLATGTIATAAQVGTVQNWVYATLPSAVTLTQGQSYRLWFESPGSSSSSNAYASSPVYGESRPSSWLEAGWGGTHCYYVSGSGSLSSSMKTADLSFSLQ